MPKSQKPAMKARKAAPRFKSEREERAFWDTHDTTEFVDWDAARVTTLPRLKPSTRTISLRLPERMLADLKVLANKRDVPYQSLLKMFLADRIAGEQERARQARVAEKASPRRSAVSRAR